MKTLKKYTALFTIILVYQLQAQVSEDALRFSSTGMGVGSRSLGMGNAYVGVADDFTASFWNPAGLGQMRRLEVIGGLSTMNFGNSAKFGTSAQNGNNSATVLDNIGFVFPVPTVRGSLVFAFGYNRVNDFTTALSFNGFNNQSSIIPTLRDEAVKYDIPFNLYLTNTNGYTPIQKNVSQSAEVREGGGIGNWSFSGATDVEKNLSFGLSLNILSGTYTYVRNYLEEDSKNLYQNTQTNLPKDSLYLRFNKFYFDNTISSELSGVNLMFGVLYRWEDFARLGMTIKTPSSVTVRETYSDAGQSFFDDGYNVKYSYEAGNNYGVQSPWVFSGGVSVYPIGGLLLAADLEYTDWSQIQWFDNPDLEKENVILKKKFRATTNIRAGAEFEVPSTDLRVRAGYILNPSPFEGDPSSFDNSIVTAGAGILLQNNVMFDAAAAFGSFKTYHNNYSFPGLKNPSRTDESVSTTSVNFTVSYRF